MRKFVFKKDREIASPASKVKRDTARLLFGSCLLNFPLEFDIYGSILYENRFKTGVRQRLSH